MDEKKLDQIAALPLGSRIRVDQPHLPGSNQARLSAISARQAFVRDHAIHDPLIARG